MLFVHPSHEECQFLRKTLSSVKKITTPRKHKPRGFPLAKLKLFHRSKVIEETQAETISVKEKIQEPAEKHLKVETKEKSNIAPIKEYNETLYSQGYAQKQPTSSPHQNKQLLKRTTWENAETIEQNVDSMRMKQSASTHWDTEPEINVEKKVDYILLKKKSRP
jgi:hypothetical protein